MPEQHWLYTEVATPEQATTGKLIEVRARGDNQYAAPVDDVWTTLESAHVGEEVVFSLITNSDDMVRSFASGNIVCNSWDGVAYVEDRELVLPEQQFEILWLFANNPDRPLSLGALVSVVRTKRRMSDTTLRVQVHNIREKLGPYRPAIQTVKGIGYKALSEFKPEVD